MVPVRCKRYGEHVGRVLDLVGFQLQIRQRRGRFRVCGRLLQDGFKIAASGRLVADSLRQIGSPQQGLTALRAPTQPVIQAGPSLLDLESHHVALGERFVDFFRDVVWGSGVRGPPEYALGR